MLNGYYQIKPLSVQKLTGGWSADAYQVVTEKQQYFLKVYDKTIASTAEWTAAIDHYMPILLWLSESTALKGSVPRSVLTVDGAFKVEQVS